MKTSFRLHGTQINLKTFDNYLVPVFPGLYVLLNQKYYLVQQAILDLEKEELLVLVTRSTTDPLDASKPVAPV